MMTATLEQRLGVGMDAIRAFCEQWGIIELALFGSVVRDDFGPDSDIDVMVRFEEGQPSGLLEFAHIQFELEELLGRKVDLMERGPIRNPFVRQTIRRDLTVSMQPNERDRGLLWDMLQYAREAVELSGRTSLRSSNRILKILIRCATCDGH